jgi:predicted RNA-binding protein with RPS1 domain
LKVLEVDEKLKRLKLSYKFLNKKRGVKGEVPKYRIGFKSLQAAVPDFIQKQLEVIKKRPLKSNLLEEGKMKIHY